jgi:hypothetical protein
MRYLARGKEVRSENAAKPACCAGTWMLNWIGGLDEQHSGLDLGCGKLRYTVPLSRRVRSVTAVDSRTQVDREQTLFGTKTSIRRYAGKNLDNVRVCALEESHWRKRHYQVVLCSNVLSAIPSKKARQELLASAYARLARGGTFLVTTQYRNSHFTTWINDPRATRYCDGFLVEGARGTSFYAILDAEALVKLCRGAGFSISKAAHHKELAYVLATR